MKSGGSNGKKRRGRSRGKLAYSGVWRRLRPGSVGIQTELAAAHEMTLFNNYPNPFNPTTTIRYALPRQASVTLRVMSILGREVRTLVDEVQAAGIQSVVWDGRDNRNEPVSSGVYIYRLQANDRVHSKEMILLK